MRRDRKARIVFLADESSASNKVREILDSVGVQYTEEHSTGYNVPSVRLGYSYFNSREGIERVARDVKSLTDPLRFD